MVLSVLILIVGLLARPNHSTTEVRTPTLAVTANPPVETATATVPRPPEVVPSTTQTAEVVAPPPPRPVATTRPGRFNRKLALAAINDATADLSRCRRQGGVWGKGQAGVVFYNDGSVRNVLMSAPFRGVEGDCVRKQITEQAHVDPFVGIIGPTYAYFVIPY